jgi:hypothetical protein
MSGNDAVREHIERLIGQVSPLSFLWGTVPHQRAWLTAAQSAVQLVCPSSTNPYHLHAQGVMRRLATTGLPEPLVSEMAALLEHLLEEIRVGCSPRSKTAQ